MHSLSRNIHAIVLTLAFAAAVAWFTAFGAVAQATKLVFEERATDSKVTKEFETNGRIEIDWRADAWRWWFVADGRQAAVLAPLKLKFQVEASGPWHIRVIEFNAPK